MGKVFKVLVVGAKGSGKTSILEKAIYGHAGVRQNSNVAAND